MKDGLYLDLCLKCEAAKVNGGHLLQRGSGKKEIIFRVSYMLYVHVTRMYIIHFNPLSKIRDCQGAVLCIDRSS